MERYVDSRGILETITDDTPTERVVAWTLKRFAGQTLVITTSFGMEGCVLIDMYAKSGQPITVIYLDTMMFFPETLELCERMIERYPHLNFVNRGSTMSLEDQSAKYGDKLWKRDSDLCCKLRKVEPMNAAMADVDVWITGLRRSQSASRANLSLVEWDWRFQVLKVSPLFKWERSQIWDYVQANNVPFNKLHEKGYPTVGCKPCTTPVPGSKPGEYSRAGRWKDSGKTECGLHGGEGI